MTELILNGNFESNTPPTDFTDWVNDSFVGLPAEVGIGEGIAGSDAAAYLGTDTGIAQLHQKGPYNLLAADTNYNLSVFLRADPGQTSGTITLGISGSYISGISHSLDIPVVSIPTTYTQYTINFTTPVTPLGPGDFILTYISSVNITNGLYVYVDNVSLLGPAVCMRGDTKIHTRANGIIFDKPLDELDAETDEVFVVSKQDFVPIKKVVRSNLTTKLCFIPAGTLEPEQDDLYMTTGHVVLYNGKPTKSRLVPGSKRITVDITPVYTIILDEEDFVLANGGKVKAHGISGYNAYLDRENI
jgi:hypothetical protein